MTDTHRTPNWNLEATYSHLPGAFFSRIQPEEVTEPELVLLNDALAESLGLDAEALKTEEGTRELAGNKRPEGSMPIAQAYAGHQFGNFTMLGDGRAVLLGEQLTPGGDRYDVQLKGSGHTPFSRSGDGRAPLGAMLREYIISEAMHGLGIPTSRSLAVVKTGDKVQRETEHIGGVLTRIASSHLRVGTFQYAAYQGDQENMKELADYALERHFGGKDQDEPYLYLLEQVVERQASLIAKWQHVGFIHGVMNTDNMTISGETIDYGPCAFMNTYDPDTVFSSIDTHGRYRYNNQPGIAEWNLVRFAEALLPLLDDDQDKAIKKAEQTLGQFAASYKKHWTTGMRQKLGFFNEEKQDEPLMEDLLDIMKKKEADFTNVFRGLTLGKPEVTGLSGHVAFDQWYKQWQLRLDRQEESIEEAQALMKRSNPSIIPRNHRVEEAIEAAVSRGDYTVVERLLSVLADPYAYTSEQEPYTEPPEASDEPYQTFCGT
ncbi:YdiU family protein [Halobacillus litoralis]|uniref:protein adenylyltransferase SelO n=1 Tax=Halobacillus litoralis TaxID=45668 RepID=UPI001CD36BD8|nr:YdiU family protein [Halobacillus litoralis]MCA0972079.1 YdiU family protein [Halobacillus litoralis]